MSKCLLCARHYDKYKQTYCGFFFFFSFKSAFRERRYFSNLVEEVAHDQGGQDTCPGRGRAVTAQSLDSHPQLLVLIQPRSPFQEVFHCFQEKIILTVELAYDTVWYKGLRDKINLVRFSLNLSISYRSVPQGSHLLDGGKNTFTI